MTFGAPWLGLAALASWLPILWLHRRRRQAPAAVVPSLAPWLALMAPPVPRRRRVRASWLLALHLAIAAALAGAVAQPAIAGRRPVDAALALVVDTTTSMGARGRWPAAVAAARAALAGARGPYTLVTAGPEPRVLAARSRTAAPLLAALDRLQPLGTGADLGAASALARAVAGEAARQVVVTDGGAAGAIDAAARIVVVGGEAEAAANVAVLDVAAEHDLERGQGRVSARVANYSAARRAIDVTLRVDGEPADAATVELGPREARTLAWRVRPDGRLAEVGVAAADDLAVDDVARVALQDRPVVVQMVGPSEPVARALAADGQVVVEQAGPATLRADGSVDVTVAAGVALGRLPPGGILWVAPPPAAGPDGAPGRARVATVGAHPLVAGLDLADAELAELTVRAAPPWSEPVLTTGDFTAVYAGVREGRREVVLAFDPAAGTVAARVGFPLLLRRIVRWLAAPGLAPEAPVLGGRLRLLDEARVETPAGGTIRVAGALPLDRPGTYAVRRGDRPPTLVAVNAGDASESDLALRRTAARDTSASGAAGAGARPIWRWLVALAMALAAGEAAWRAAPARRRSRA